MVGGTAQQLNVRNNVWNDDPLVLAWVAMLQPLLEAGSVTVSGPIAVTGTFWPATQPVSGTFWQTTQPVSGTVTAGIDQTTVGTTDSVTVKKTALTAASPAAVSVGIVSGQILAANASRKGCMIVNTSANYVSIGVGAAAVLYSGVTLNPSGGAFWMDEYSLSAAAVNAIASGAASNLGVQEFT